MWIGDKMQRHYLFPFISHDLSSRQKRLVILLVNVFFIYLDRHGALKCQLLTIFLIRASSNYGIRKQLTTKLPEMMATALQCWALTLYVVLSSTLPSLCPKHPKIESHAVWKSIQKSHFEPLRATIFYFQVHTGCPNKF